MASNWCLSSIKWPDLILARYVSNGPEAITFKGSALAKYLVPTSKKCFKLDFS